MKAKSHVMRDFHHHRGIQPYPRQPLMPHHDEMVQLFSYLKPSVSKPIPATAFDSLDRYYASFATTDFWPSEFYSFTGMLEPQHT